jgi:hypothetical protein
MRRHESDIQTAFRQRRRDLVVVQLMKAKNDIGMLVSPGRQQGLQRIPDGRHPHAQSDMAGHSGPAALADLPHAVEAIEGSPDRDHDPPAGCREANPKGPTLDMVTPSSSSRRMMRLLMVEGLTPSDSAAPEKLPVSTTIDR